MNAEQYYKKLIKLIKDCPPECKLVYDYMTTSLFVVLSDSEFFDNEKPNLSAIVGSTTPQNGMGYGSDTGFG